MKLIRALLVLMMLLPFSAAAAPTFPQLTGQVVDAANVLTPEQKAQLEALSASVEQASTRQLVIATIPDLQGYDIADYGYQLGRAWKIGQKDANNGIILIVAPNDHKVRIEVGYGLEPIMTDALANRIIQEQIIPRFKDKDIPGGIVAGANAIAEQMKLPLEAAEQRAKATAPPPRQARHHGGGFPIAFIFWIVIFLFVIIPMIARGARGRRYHGGGGGSGIMPVVLWGIANEIGREASRGSGSWGGGSSWGGGGGGGWGGGGGGGFSGGGGSFGGGGASGSW